MADELTPEFKRRWTFPVDEEAKELLRQSDEEYPKMTDMEKLAWHTRYLRWLEALDV